MDSNAIWVVLGALVLLGLIWRSASTRGKSTIKSPEPGPGNQNPSETIPGFDIEVAGRNAMQIQLMDLSKSQLANVATELGIQVRSSWNKSRIVDAILESYGL